MIQNFNRGVGERIKNGKYKTYYGSREVEITDSMQPVFILNRRRELYNLKATIAKTSMSDELIVIPIKDITLTPYKKSWQSKKMKGQYLAI